MSSCSFVARNNSEKSLCVRVTAFIFICLLMYREIENYYSRDAIQRLITNANILPIDFQIEDYSDIKEDIKTHIIQGLHINFKAKNNFNIFDEMTREEWLACAFPVEGSTDLEIIIAKVLEV